MTGAFPSAPTRSVRTLLARAPIAFVIAALGMAPRIAAQTVPARLTLDEAVQIAETYSLAFRREANNLDRADITLSRDFRTTFLPQFNGGITLSGSRFRNYTAENFNGIPLDTPVTTIGSSSTASQALNVNLTLFSGANLLQYRASRASSRATDVSVEAQRTALRVALTGLFYRVIQADDRVALERQGLERARSDLESAQTRFGFGLVDREQVLVAERALFRREQVLETEIGNARKIRLDLLEAMGVADEVPFEPVGDLPEPFDPILVDVETLVEAAVTSSPTIRLREAQLQSTTAGASAARASRWPTITGSGGFSRSATSPDYGSFFEVNPRNWGYTLRLQVAIPVPFLNYSQNANLALAQINVEQAREEFAFERTVIENDVRKAMIDLQAAYGAVIQQEREVELATELLFILEERNRAGQPIDYDRLDVARETEVSAERALFGTRIAFQNQLLALEQLVGREIRP